MLNSGSDQSGRFNSAYGETPPAWDVGEAQPALLALFDELPPAGPALDVGCGTGETVFALARRGLDVLGIDLAENAIAQAESKAAALPDEVRTHVQFQVSDALHPSALGRTFMTVVDSGFFHVFGPAEREQFVNELAATLPVGGRYYVLGFGFDSPLPMAPKKVTEDEIRERFAPERGWKILALRPAQFKIRRGPGLVLAVAACVERNLAAE